MIHFIENLIYRYPFEAYCIGAILTYVGFLFFHSLSNEELLLKDLWEALIIVPFWPIIVPMGIVYVGGSISGFLAKHEDMKLWISKKKRMEKVLFEKNKSQS